MIAETIGAGGMGVVYRARRDDAEFHREVAIKVTGARLFAPEIERRFIEESKLAQINGTVAIRQGLIEKTLVYLEALSTDAGNSPPLMIDLIESYLVESLRHRRAFAGRARKELRVVPEIRISLARARKTRCRLGSSG